MKNFLKYIIPAVIVGVLVSGVAVAQVTNPNFFKLIGNTIQPILNSYGFKVGNFTVDTSGNATTSNLSVTGTCTGCGVPTSRAINTTAPLQGGGDFSANRTFSITQASSTANGYLTSTDWNTFNGKQNALGFTPEQVLTFNSPLSRSTNTISLPKASSTADGYLSQTDWSTFNNKQNALTTGNFSESTSSVLTVTGGTGAILGNGLIVQVKQASSTQSGYLSSTDWSTFNGKQSALVSGTNIKTINGNTLLGSGDLAISSGSGLSTTSPFTSGKVPYATSTLALTDSPISISGGNVGIGTSSPVATLAAQGSSVLPTTDIFRAASSSGATVFNITSTGRVGIGTTGPGGLLDISSASVGEVRSLQISDSSVNGGSFRDIVWRAIGGGGPTFDYAKIKAGYGASFNNSSLSFSVADASAVLQERMRIDNLGNVGIGTTSPAYKLDIYGGNSSAGDIYLGNWDAGTTLNALNLNGMTGTGNYNFLSGRTDNTLYINRPSGASISFRENNVAQMTIAGTSGNVGIGTTTPTTKLFIQNAAGATDIFAIASSSGITLMKVDAQGNLNVPHIIGNTATPTIATSTGAGASATSTIAGTDLSGLIQVNTFSADTPSASADIATITFNKAYGSAPYCTIVPANDATWNLTYGIWRYRQSDTTTTIFKIRSGGTPLPATTNAVYAWTYHCVQ